MSKGNANAHQDILYYGESVLEHIDEVFHSGDSTTDHKTNAGEYEPMKLFL